MDYNKREEYIEKLTTKLKMWNEKISELETQANNMSSDAKTEVDKRIEDLQAKRDEVKKNLNEAAGSSREAFENIKDGFEKAGIEIEKAIDSILASFKH